MPLIKPHFLIHAGFAISLTVFSACTQSDPASATESSSSNNSAATSSSSLELRDYSAGARMNTLLGKGINFGNSWDSGTNTADTSTVRNYLDDDWNNAIQDEWFQIAKKAGFTSIRLPVRWNQTALNEPPYTLQAERVAGVKEDVRLANSLGMPVIINMHHYLELYEYPVQQMPKFCAMWRQIAEEFKDFSNDSLVFEILNESRGYSDNYLNELIDSAYHIIRASNPGRTIMINPGNWGHFEGMEKIKLPSDADGNIIISGHYYEPYKYTHQGASADYACGVVWDSTNKEALTSIVSDFKSFVAMAKTNFPGKNGTHIPLNMGEFGASNDCSQITNANRASYISTIVTIANALGISWHYWGFTGVEFDAYDKSGNAWYPEILKALLPNSPSL
ncbi:MAG: glycoside hydrolase family 5 protein [Fibrobacteraceae bacterium]|nr:glycoside hydrolase family 5 protein [Fibrobacteraceae bacterium]